MGVEATGSAGKREATTRWAEKAESAGWSLWLGAGGDLAGIGENPILG